MSDDDCEDKNWFNHCLESSIICIICKNPYSMRCISMFVYQGVQNVVAKVCYLLNKYFVYKKDPTHLNQFN